MWQSGNSSQKGPSSISNRLPIYLIKSNYIYEKVPTFLRKMPRVPKNSQTIWWIFFYYKKSYSFGNFLFEVA